MSEAPFVSRDKLIETQKYFQGVQKYTHLKGRYDIITSVAIPVALTVTTTYMIVVRLIFESRATTQKESRGIYNMAHGVGKKE